MMLVSQINISYHGVFAVFCNAYTFSYRLLSARTSLAHEMGCRCWRSYDLASSYSISPTVWLLTAHSNVLLVILDHQVYLKYSTFYIYNN